MCSISSRLPPAVRGRVRLRGRILPRRTSRPVLRQLVIDRIASGIGGMYQVESVLCSFADSASSNDGDLLRSRLRLAAVGEQILAEITLRHVCLKGRVYLTWKYDESRP